MGYYVHKYKGTQVDGVNRVGNKIGNVHEVGNPVGNKVGKALKVVSVSQVYYVHLRSVLSDSSKIYYVHHRVHTQLSGCGVAQSGLGRWTHNPEIEGSNPSPATKVEACDVRGKVFSALSGVRSIGFLLRNATLLDVAIHAHVGFSIGLKRLASWRFSGKGLFSGFIVSLAIVKLFRVGYRLLFSACMDVAVFVYGMVMYGNK